MMKADELRAMVRDVLREALQQKGGAPCSVEHVRIGNDSELASFVRLVIEMQDAIKAGQLRFTLGTPPSNASAGGAVLHGVVSESVVDKHAGAGVLVLGPDAVITPLARERARKLKLTIERRS
jgi:hypothetical protein